MGAGLLCILDHELRFGTLDRQVNVLLVRLPDLVRARRARLNQVGKEGLGCLLISLDVFLQIVVCSGTSGDRRDTERPEPRVEALE